MPSNSVRMSSIESIATPTLPTSPCGDRVVGVVAHLGRQVEGDRQPAGAGLDQLVVALVGLRGGAEPGVLAHRPRPAGVHRRVDAAGERVRAGLAEPRRRVPAGRAPRARRRARSADRTPTRATWREPNVQRRYDDPLTSTASDPWPDTPIMCRTGASRARGASLTGDDKGQRFDDEVTPRARRRGRGPGRVGHGLAAPRQPAQPTTAPSTVGGERLATHGIVVDAPGATALPKVGASSYLLADLDTGEVLAAKDPHGRLRPASTLKVLTALTLMPKLSTRRRLHRAVGGRQRRGQPGRARAGRHLHGAPAVPGALPRVGQRRGQRPGERRRRGPADRGRDERHRQEPRRAGHHGPQPQRPGRAGAVHLGLRPGGLRPRRRWPGRTSATTSPRSRRSSPARCPSPGRSARPSRSTPRTGCC